MPKYDFSDQETMLRSYRGTKIYMASHPEIRKHLRNRERPTEFGDKIWDMTFRLMTYLEQESGPLNHILDVVCGWGLLGIHLARLNQAKVTCIDTDSKLEPIVLKHAALNDVAIAFKAARFQEISESDLEVDLLIGSEICYCEALRIELSQLADRAAHANTKRMLIADPGRPDFDDLYEYCRSRHSAKLIDIRLPEETKPTYLMSIRF